MDIIYLLSMGFTYRTAPNRSAVLSSLSYWEKNDCNFSGERVYPRSGRVRLICKFFDVLPISILRPPHSKNPKKKGRRKGEEK